MAETAELDVAPDTIEATLNYIVDDGKPVFTIVATPGKSDTRSDATPDPRRVHCAAAKMSHCCPRRLKTLPPCVS